MTREPQVTTIVIRNQLAELERMSATLETFGKNAGLAAKPLFELTLAVNEVVTNVISYAYADRREHEIVIRLAREPGQVSVEVEDDGRPFNPLRVPEPALQGPLAERAVGGLGLHLVRKMTDGLEYHRRGDKNVLVLRKRVALMGEADSHGARAMTLSEKEEHGLVVLTPAGRLDAGAAATLEEVLQRRMDAGSRRVVVDGCRLDYIGSAGLRVILVAAKQLQRAGGELVLAGLTESVHEVFEIAGLTSVLKVFASTDDAVGALR